MHKISLKEWVILLTILPTTLISLSVAGYFSYNSYIELESALTLRAQSIIEPIAIASAQPAQEKNRKKLRNLIDFTHRSQSDIIKSVAIFTAENQILVTSDFHGDANLMRLKSSADIPITTEQEDFNDYFIFRTPIFNEVINNDPPAIIGYIAIQIDKSKLQLIQQTHIFFAFSIVLIGALISSIFTLKLIKNVTHPVTSMVKAVDRIREGKLESRVSGELIGELSFLKTGINAMAHSLGNYHNEMQRSVDQATIDLRASLEQFEIQNVELSIAKRKAQSANKVKSEFLANMSHELRTPLNGVIGFTRQILKTPLADIQRDYLQTIERSANNLLHIINDILDFSKLDAGKMVIEHIPFSFIESSEETLALLAPIAHQKNIELSINIPTDIPGSLIGDAMRIQQIMSNLISNALKFTEQGSVSVDIMCESIIANKGTFKVSVTDTGIGMSYKQQKTIFEAFGQADNSITRLYGGTGLGLVISKRLANAMYGDMGFISKENIGSTFWFTFQVEINPLAITSTIKSKALESKTVLYYEPNEHSRNATLEILLHWKMNVTPVKTLDQLTKKLSLAAKKGNKEPLFDYALIGHGMAVSALTELKKMLSDILPIIPTVHLAVNSNSPSLQEALLASGATSCISKPITASRLLRSFQPNFSAFSEGAFAPEQPKMPIKVLAVDDNKENLKLIHVLLDELVTEIVLAKDGREAVELCKTEMFSMIFMDIQMPIMDGITALEKITKTTKNSKTPIIAVTAHALGGEKEKFKQQGFTTYLAKPIDDKMLSHVIYEYCDLDLHFHTFDNASYNNDLLKLDKAEPNNLPLNKEQTDLNKAKVNQKVSNVINIKTAQEKTIDWSLALKRTGNKTDLAKEMLSGLVDSLPETKNAIEEAITSQNSDKIRSLIHKLNGACCYTGVPNLGKISLLIETELKKGANLEDLEPEFLEFFEHIEQILIAAPKVLSTI